jgi:hypothetical protein
MTHRCECSTRACRGPAEQAGFGRMSETGTIPEWSLITLRRASVLDPRNFWRSTTSLEKTARQGCIVGDDLRLLRQQGAAPVLRELHQYLLKIRDEVLPKSPAGQAVSYALKNWQALLRCLEDGGVSIDNNHTERSLRGIAVGRRNWLFVGSDRGGRTMAILRSFVGSCEMVKVDPFAWFQDVLSRIGEQSIGAARSPEESRTLAGCLGCSSWSSPLNVSQREIESGSLIDQGIGPDATSVSGDDPLNDRQADPVALKLRIAVQPLEGREEFVGVGHIEPGAVIPDGEDGFGSPAFLSEYNLRVGPFPPCTSRRSQAGFQGRS